VSSTASRLKELKTLFPKKELELKKLKNSAIEYKDYLASKPSIWPIKARERKITSYFGYRTHPITGERTIHEGLDIGVWYGTKVYTTGKGRVTHAGWKGGYGRAVIIDHGYGFKTIYGHNQRLNVSVGDRVERGDIIAYSGNSGRSTGPHLHYEILINGRSVDPLSYVE
jgi:murein DD-endopeptidase MepM/ murein hydrolase activator NlpD